MPFGVRNPINKSKYPFLISRQTNGISTSKAWVPVLYVSNPAPRWEVGQMEDPGVQKWLTHLFLGLHSWPDVWLRKTYLTSLSLPHKLVMRMKWKWCYHCWVVYMCQSQFQDHFLHSLNSPDNILLKWVTAAAAAVVPDSVRPHRRQPTRLPRPWDSPGKNTGVACHFLLQCLKVKNEIEVVQSFLTLSDPMDCSLPGSSVHGIFQARVLEWGAIAFSINKLLIHYIMIKMIIGNLSSNIGDTLY